MSKEYYDRLVYIHRTFRDGNVTDEYLPRWLAEMRMGSISQSEPMTARAIIVEPQAIVVDPSAEWVPSKRPVVRWDIACQMADVQYRPITNLAAYYSTSFMQ
jgi:hypothetical protein